jgi:hypothetical protein
VSPALHLLRTYKLAFAALIALMVTALMLVGLPAVAAHALAAPSITLTVADASNALVSGANVELFEQQSGGATWTQSTNEFTDDNGQVTFGELTATSHYLLSVNMQDATADGGSPPSGASGWVTSTQSTTLQADGVGPGILPTEDGVQIAVVAPNGNTVSGSVATDPADAAGHVDAYRVSTDITTGASSLVPAGGREIVDGGSYSIPNLPDGDYYFRFTDGNNATDGHPATSWNAGAALGLNHTSGYSPLNVTGDTTQNVDYAAGAATITGTVVNGDGDGSGVTVSAFPVDSNGIVDTNTASATQVQTDGQDGAYSLVVSAGTYAVLFTPSETDANPDDAQWYSTTYDSSVAQKVTVGPGDTATDIDGSLTEGFTIQGTVTEGGQPLAGVTVTLRSKFTGSDPMPVVTDANGSYEFDSLLPDAYTVQYTPAVGSGLSAAYYTGASHGSAKAVNALAVGSAIDTKTVDFDFAALSTLTLHVTNKAGAGIKGIGGFAIPVVNGVLDSTATSLPLAAVTGKTGSYTVAGVAQGVTYTFEFFPQTGAAAGYFAQYLGGASIADPIDAQTFTIPLGVPTSSLDVTLESTAAISGVVVTPGGSKLKSVTVQLFRFDGATWNQVDQTTTSSKGAYSFPNEADGSYKLGFLAGSGALAGYATIYSGGRSTLAAATSYYVRAGKPLAVNMRMVTGGTITGTLKTPGGALAAGFDVHAYQLTGTPGAFTAATPIQTSAGLTGAKGTYSIAGLATGYYAVSFSAHGGVAGGSPVYADAFNPTNLAIAGIKVTAGKTTASGIQSLVDPAGAGIAATVTGHVLGVDTTKAGGSVTLVSSDNRYSFAYSINADGSFGGPVLPGTYSYTASPTNIVTGVAYESEAGMATIVSGDNPLTVTSGSNAPEAFLSTPTLTPTDETVVGTVYTAHATWNHASTEKVTYQWLRGGHPIFGAQSVSYTARGGDSGAQFSARITLTDPSSLVSITAVVQGATITDSPALVDVSAPTITPTGAHIVGTTLTALPGSWSIPNAVIHYQWMRGDSAGVGAPIAKATARAYKTVTADINHDVWVSVAATAVGYTTPDAVVSNHATVLPPSGPKLKTAPKVTGSPIAGYTVSKGTWSPTPTGYDYSWFADGAPIGSDSPTLQPTADGAAITVTVTASKTNLTSGSTTVLAHRGAVAAPVAEAILIDGAPVDPATATPSIGDTVAITPGVTDYPMPQNVVHKYQWQRKNGATWASIKGATKTSYVVSSADANHLLHLVISEATADYLPFSYTTQVSDLPVTGTSAALVGTVALSIPSSITTGTKVSAVLSNFASGVKHTYQWQTAAAATPGVWSPIAGATASSYTPTIGAAGSFLLRVEVTTTKSGVNPSPAIDSPPATVVQYPTLAATLSPTISGTGAVGTTLTASAGTWNTTGVTVRYQWARGGVAIPGATASTFVPTGTGLGDEMTVTVTASKSHFITGTALSTVTKVIAGAAPTVSSSSKPKVTGTLGAGKTLTVSTGLWSLDGLTFSYQWFVNGQPIDPSQVTNLGNQHSYLVTGSDCGKITVSVTASRQGYASSAPVIVTAGSLPVCIP